MSMTPPGWYPDPQNPAGQRWWDGQAWGDPAPSAPAAPVMPSPPAYAPAVASQRPGNYLAWSIINLACLCLPFGIAALIFSLQVNGKADAGDLAGAQAAASKARTFNIVATVLGLLWVVIWVVLAITGNLTVTTSSY